MTLNRRYFRAEKIECAQIASQVTSCQLGYHVSISCYIVTIALVYHFIISLNC